MYFNRQSYSKYNAIKTDYDGQKFDSKKELWFYLYLKDLEKENIIKDIKRQVKYELQPSFKYGSKTIRSINYIADFTCIVVDADKFKKAIGYQENKKASDGEVEEGKTVILDTKGYKTEVYKIKYKLMLYKGHKIFEI